MHLACELLTHEQGIVIEIKSGELGKQLHEVLDLCEDWGLCFSIGSRAVTRPSTLGSLRRSFLRSTHSVAIG
jgi:hypothetical protein